MRQKRHAQRVLEIAADLYAPSPERRQHGRIVRVSKQLADVNGDIGMPFRAVETLEAMERAGTISQEMRDAGERFREDFALGQLDALRAADMERAGLGSAAHGPYRGVTLGQAAERARRRVWDQIGCVGGLASPGGSCLWGVLGWQQSLSEWAMTGGWCGRRVSPQSAGGILATALGVLAVEK